MVSFFRSRNSEKNPPTDPPKPDPYDPQDAILAKAIVDPAFYGYRHPDIAETGMDFHTHFAKFGWLEKRDPNPFTHMRFVERQYPELFEDFGTLIRGFEEPIYHNALMRRPATLQEINDAAALGNEAYAELFNLDVENYSRAQKDVQLKSHLDPLQHLFYDGLLQNRLRAGKYLSSVFLDVERYKSDYEFLIDQEAPLKATGFSTLELGEHQQEAELDVSDTVLGVGTLLYNNSIQEITRLLHSVEANFKETGFSCQCHIWDNSPTPLDPAVFKDICPELDIVFSPHPENPGFAKGHNGIMEECFASGCTHYLGLNPDGHLLPGSLEGAIRFAKTKPHPALIELEAEPLSHPKWYHPITGQTDWVSGAAFLLDAATFELTGGFDPEFPMYCEDVDLSFRAFQAGVKLYVAPNARYYHDTSYRLYTPEPWRNHRSLVGTWYLCEKWGDTIRAGFVMAEIERQSDMDIELPPKPNVVDDIDPKISELLSKERFSRSRFWGP